MEFANVNQQESLMIQTPRSSIFRLILHPKIKITRRRKVASVRLGGKKRRRGFALLKLLKRIKLRWLKVQYTCMLQKLKSYYESVVRDLIEAGAALETVQQRIMMEAYFTVPVMGVSIVGATAPPRILTQSTASNHLRIKNY